LDVGVIQGQSTLLNHFFSSPLFYFRAALLYPREPNCSYSLLFLFLSQKRDQGFSNFELFFSLSSLSSSSSSSPVTLWIDDRVKTENTRFHHFHSLLIPLFSLSFPPRARVSFLFEE
jgi:hypothetical protein